jgi:hypothetical protein
MAARFLGLRVRIPAGAWLSVSCDCCVLSGRDLCDRPITCPQKSYQEWCVWVWLRNLIEEALGPPGLSSHKKKNFSTPLLTAFLHALCSKPKSFLIILSILPFISVPMSLSVKVLFFYLIVSIPLCLIDMSVCVCVIFLCHFIFHFHLHNLWLFDLDTLRSSICFILLLKYFLNKL